MKNILITGCSSGYGLETARHFHAQGWNVIATMRTPREDVLPRSERLRVLALDVTKPERIAAALEAVRIQTAGSFSRRDEGSNPISKGAPPFTMRMVIQTKSS